MLAKANDTEISDLFEFYRQWPELRRCAVALSKRRDMTETEQDVLHWMIRVVDRVGPSDLN